MYFVCTSAPCVHCFPDLGLVSFHTRFRRCTRQYVLLHTDSRSNTIDVGLAKRLAQSHPCPPPRLGDCLSGSRPIARCCSGSTASGPGHWPSAAAARPLVLLLLSSSSPPPLLILISLDMQARVSPPGQTRCVLACDPPAPPPVPWHQIPVAIAAPPDKRRGSLPRLVRCITLHPAGRGPAAGGSSPARHRRAHDGQGPDDGRGH